MGGHHGRRLGNDGNDLPYIFDKAPGLEQLVYCSEFIDPSCSAVDQCVCLYGTWTDGQLLSGGQAGVGNPGTQVDALLCAS